MPLLVHSMSDLRSLILPLLEMAGCRRVIEIGGEFGGMTSELLLYVRQHDGILVTIDKSPQAELHDLAGTAAELQLIEATSLEVLPTIELADAYLIDGDHNYFTVFHELATIFGCHRKSGTHPLVFLHDVGWPCAYRDLYYGTVIHPGRVVSTPQLGSGCHP